MKKGVSFLIYVVFFYLIYTPSFSNSILFDKNITIPVLTVGLVAYALINKKKDLFQLIRKRYVVIFVILLFLSNVVYLISYLVFNSDFSLYDSRILQNSLPIFYVASIGILLQTLFSQGHSKKTIFNILINLAVFQGIVCILMVLIPSFKELALTLYYKGGEENIFISGSRIFGISSDYTYATPIYHGFLASCLFYRVLEGNKKAIISMMLILFAVILNGRTGLLVFFINCILITLLYSFRKGKISSLVKFIVLTCFIVIVVSFFLYKFSPATYQFVVSMIHDTGNLLLYSNYSGNYDILKKTLYFPKGISFFFGEGHRVYGAVGEREGYVSSDIGYVNDMFMGGIIYMLLLYGSYLYLLFNSFKSKSMFSVCLKYMLVTTFIIANFKGEAFRSSILIFLILFICLLEVIFCETGFNKRSSSSL